MRKNNYLMIADSEHDANMLYAAGLFVPDPFIHLRIRGVNYLIMSDLEIDRARSKAGHCRVLSLSDWQERLRTSGVKAPKLADVAAAVLREKRIQTVDVPSSFPLGLADHLNRLGIRVRAAEGHFFPERDIKTPDEVRQITAAQRMAEAGVAEAVRVLKASRISRNRRLMFRGAILTSERLRAFVETVVAQAGGLASHTIVAGGNQACDPHETGHGPLKAGEPIIIDVFPRSQKTGHFGDITRTVVKGRASEAARKMYDTVFRANELGRGMMKPGKQAASIHKAVQDFFVREGYPTGKNRQGRMQGFFHGTGHGVGLEIHEQPRVSLVSEDRLAPGHVVTIEPGLYYPGIGGARVEDLVVITARGNRNLTRLEKQFEI